MSSTSKALSHALSSLSSDLQGRSGSRSNKNRRNPKRRNRQRNRRRYPRPQGILAGYGSALTSSFYTSHARDGCICRGVDLITNSFTQGYNISFFASANPITWAGTRISAIAMGFQNYRPIKFKIHYRPQVGSTSELSVFIGTVWQSNSIHSRSAIEPSLLTSPGGTYLPAWQSSTSIVPLGRNLPQRMFPVRDPTFEVVPFAVVARSSAGGPDADSVALPGRIFIEYEYQFHNAVGTDTSSQVAITRPVVLTDQTNPQRSGWIIDYADTQPSESLPLFAHLQWDFYGSGYRPTIEGIINTSGSTALVYTQGSNEI